MIKQETLERIRVETDIVELVGGYLPLKKVGRNYRGVCPFHPDRSPSFYVSPERQTYHCFGCGAGGNAFGFVMERENLAFPEAVRLLADRLGIEVGEDRSDRHKGLYEACEQAARFYEQQLRASDAALRYLVERRVAPEVVKRYRLGYAPGGNRLRGEIRRRDLRLEDFQGAGLISDRGAGPHDWFSERIMFPILSPAGKVVGFGGRTLGEREPKYLNSPETPIFHKGDGLYGLFQAKACLREDRALLVEGNFDLLALAGNGFRNVVAPLGTAFTPGQALLLRRYTGDVTVCFDGDAAGRRAALRSLEPLLRAGLDCLVARLPDDSDPDDVIRSDGPGRLAELLAEAVDFVGFVTGGPVPADVAGQRKALGALVALLRVIPDPATRELYANRVAELFRVDKRALGEQPPPAAARKAVRGLRPGPEEQVVAALVLDRKLAGIAVECGLTELLSDPGLKAIAEKAVALAEQGGVIAGLLDEIEEPELRKKIAGWTLKNDLTCPPADFRRRVLRLRSARLQETIGRADQSEVMKFSREKSDLLRRVERGGQADDN